jgi:hypothetical protein
MQTTRTIASPSDPATATASPLRRFVQRNPFAAGVLVACAAFLMWLAALWVYMHVAVVKVPWDSGVVLQGHANGYGSHYELSCQTPPKLECTAYGCGGQTAFLIR